MAIYTMDMFTTGNDDDNRAVVRAVPARRTELRRPRACTGRATPSTRFSRALRCTHESSAIPGHGSSGRGPARRGGGPARAGTGRGPGPGARLRRQPHRLQGPVRGGPAAHRRLPDPAPGRRGVIEAVGPGVDPGRVGERVWLWLAAAGRRWGTAAEWTVGAGAACGAAARRRLVRARCLAGRARHDRALLPVLRRPGERPDRTGGRGCRRGRSLRHRIGQTGRGSCRHDREQPREGGAGREGGRGPGGELPLARTRRSRSEAFGPPSTGSSRWRSAPTSSSTWR